MGKQYFVYILGNNKPVLYIGTTVDLKRRLKEHQRKRGAKFTSKYNTNKLLFYEAFKTQKEAYKRERQLKNWHREWKINLIKQQNPNLYDLSQKLLK